MRKHNKYIHKIEQVSKYNPDMLTRGAFNLAWNKALPQDIKDQFLDKIDEFVEKGIHHKGDLNPLIDQYTKQIQNIHGAKPVLEALKGHLHKMLEALIEDIKKEKAA